MFRDSAVVLLETNSSHWLQTQDCEHSAFGFAQIGFIRSSSLFSLTSYGNRIRRTQDLALVEHNY
jgi:hypothetical protein